MALIDIDLKTVRIQALDLIHFITKREGRFDEFNQTVNCSLLERRVLLKRLMTVLKWDQLHVYQNHQIRMTYILDNLEANESNWLGAITSATELAVA
ncbi:hypothetical protein Lser_V15G12017 [Lactuca serriola]